MCVELNINLQAEVLIRSHNLKEVADYCFKSMTTSLHIPS